MAIQLIKIYISIFFGKYKQEFKKYRKLKKEMSLIRSLNYFNN